ncbi:MAG: hypothetical protein J0H79_15490 [Alphaproteobacteria bacterium]|nr:hypothetical protein [Alphaproteobacteria bacterium]
MRAENWDSFAQFAHLLGVSATDLAWILEKGGKMHEERRVSIEAARTNVGRRTKGSGVAGATVRGIEGQSLGRIVVPASGARAMSEQAHKTAAHYRLRNASGDYLRLDCEGLTREKASAWIGTEAQLRKVVERFPLALGMRAFKEYAEKNRIPVPASM